METRKRSPRLPLQDPITVTLPCPLCRRGILVPADYLGERRPLWYSRGLAWMRAQLALRAFQHPDLSRSERQSMAGKTPQSVGMWPFDYWRTGEEGRICFKK